MAPLSAFRMKDRFDMLLGGRTDVGAAWQAFRELVLTPVGVRETGFEGNAVILASDRLAYEIAGLSPTTIVLDFTRDASFVDADDEFEGTFGVTLTIECPRSPKLDTAVGLSVEGLGVSEPRGGTYFGGTTVGAADAWLDAVERSDAFGEGLAVATAWHCLDGAH